MAASIPVSAVRVPAAAGGREVRRGLRDLPTIGALVAVVVGAIVLVGWWLGIDVLKSIVPGQLTMKVNTAIGFILLGVGMLLRTRGSRAAILPISVVLALSAVVGSQYLLGRDLGVDQWLFRELPGQLGTVQPNRMAPATIICFLFLGTGFLLVGRRAVERIAPALFLGALLIAFLSVLDVAFGATSPTLLGGFTQLALVTAATIMVVSIGALDFVPGGGPLAAFAGASGG